MKPTKTCSYCEEPLPRERFTRSTRTCDPCWEMKDRQAEKRAAAGRVPPSFPSKFGKAMDATLPAGPPQ